MSGEKLNVVTRFARAAYAVGRVSKDGRNKSQGYVYATHESLVAAVREHFFEQGLVLLVDVIECETETLKSASGSIGYRTLLTVRYTVVGAEGDTLIYNIRGEGINYGDKSYRVAFTSCLKTWLLQAFLINTADSTDADSDDPPKQGATATPATQEQRNEIIALCGSEAIAQKRFRRYWDALTTKQYIAIKNKLIAESNNQTQAVVSA